MKKLNKFIIPMIAGALTIGSLTNVAYADPSELDNEYQIVIVEYDHELGKYVKRVSYTEHAYYSMTGFCNICGETVNEGNHTNKITNNKGGILEGKDEESGIPVISGNKDGVIEGKDEESGIPVLSENTVTLKMNNNLISIDCKTGTYKEVFDYIKNQGYTDFTVKNYWNTQIYSWYKFDDKKICTVIFENSDQSKREENVITQTLKINGKSVDIACKSGTYKEVFDYIKNEGYTDFTVKNYWGTVVYSWYGIAENGKCEVIFK